MTNILLPGLTWLFFSVIVSLAHFGIAALILRARGRGVKFIPLLKDGSLLFFSATLTATSFGDFYLNIQFDLFPWFTFMALVGVIMILFFSIGIYGSIVGMVDGPSLPGMDPEVILKYSVSIAGSSIIYGLTLFIGKISINGTS